MLCLIVFAISITDYISIISRPLDYGSGTKESVNIFTDAQYFKYTEKKPQLELDAIQINILNNGESVTTVEPIGIYHGEQGPVNYEALNGYIDNIEKTLHLTGEAHLYTEQRSFKSPNIFYNVTKELLKAREGVVNKSRPNKFESYIVNSEELDAYLGQDKMYYRKNVNGKIIRSRAYEPPILFKGQTMDLDLKSYQADFKNNIWIKRLGMQATARNGVIYLENYNKKLKYSVLNDDVRLTEKFKNSVGKEIERRAFSEKLEVFNQERKVIMTGAPRVIQGKDVIKGNKITLKEKTELVEIDDSKSSFQMQ